MWSSRYTAPYLHFSLPPHIWKTSTCEEIWIIVRGEYIVKVFESEVIVNHIRTAAKTIVLQGYPLVSTYIQLSSQKLSVSVAIWDRQVIESLHSIMGFETKDRLRLYDNSGAVIASQESTILRNSSVYGRTGEVSSSVKVLAYMKEQRNGRRICHCFCTAEVNNCASNRYQNSNSILV
jgi:hypothetical protein